MTTEIKICMGSACFAKGNQENLEADISIVGALCENKCEAGPRIIINEKEYTNVTKEQIKEVLDSYKKIMNLN